MIREVHKFNPDCKLVFLMRNPVDRDWSAARYLRDSRKRWNIEKEIDLEKALQSAGIMARSEFIGTLDRWSQVFDKSQILIEFFDDIVHHPEDLVRRVFRHLGVDDQIPLDGAALREKVNSSTSAAIPMDLYKLLCERHLDQLRQLSERFGSYANTWLEDARKVLGSDSECPDNGITDNRPLPGSMAS